MKMDASNGRGIAEVLGEALVRLARADERVVFVDADLEAGSGGGPFAREFPDRYFNVGVSEQDLILTAAGLALAGCRVFAGSTASFLVGKAYDPVRNVVALPRLPVTLIGGAGGVSLGGDGVTRQMLEDLALMRPLPGMTVLVPSDRIALEGILAGLEKLKGPAYLRLGVGKTPPVSEERVALLPGEGRLLREGNGLTICACGVMVREALLAAEVLVRQGIDAEVLDCYSVKPLPEPLILDSVRRTGCCVVAEEHSSIGGLGGAVAEFVSARCPVPIRFVSVGDRFGQSGNPEELREYYGLTCGEIVGAAAEAWSMRRR
jgi:transketolase